MILTSYKGSDNTPYAFTQYQIGADGTQIGTLLLFGALTTISYTPTADCTIMQKIRYGLKGERYDRYKIIKKQNNLRRAV